MPETLDVRELPPARRHDRIHEAFDALDPGEHLVLVNDHEPKPLFYELREERPAFDADRYEVSRRGPGEFRAVLAKED